MAGYVPYNPNPKGDRVGDCTVRAICKALDLSWPAAYAGLAAKGYEMSDMPSSNAVWARICDLTDLCETSSPWSARTATPLAISPGIIQPELSSWHCAAMLSASATAAFSTAGTL